MRASRSVAGDIERYVANGGGVAVRVDGEGGGDGGKHNNH